MKAVILAGGKGSRLAPYTTVLPKPLMPIVDTPILEIVLKQLKTSGIDDVVIAVGHLASLIKTYFGDGSELGIRIEYAHESTPLGTAGPLANIDSLTETFLVMNGDILTDLDYANLVDHHRASGAIMTIATHKRTVKIDFGVLGDSRRRRQQVRREAHARLRGEHGDLRDGAAGARSLIKKGEYLDLPDLVRLLLGLRGSASRPIHSKAAGSTSGGRKISTRPRFGSKSTATIS